MELTCDRCGRSSYVPDDLVRGRPFRARCPDCEGILEVPAERPNALDDGDLAWLSGEAREGTEAPAPAPRKVGEQSVAQYERRAGAERRRHGAAIAAALLAAIAAGAGVAIWLSGRVGAGPLAKQARAEHGPVAAATYDAAGLAAKEVVEAPVPAPAPAAAPAPTRVRKRTGRISRDDRRLLDLLTRKDDVAVVAPEGDTMDGAAAGLDAAAVSRTLATSHKAFDACVSRALRLDPSLHVARRATLVVTVQPTGAVTGAFVAEEEVDRTDLGGCLSAAARRMVFPAFDGEATDIAMPLSLSKGS